MSQVYDEPIVVRLTVPVGPYPVGTEFGFKDVADAIRVLGSANYFVVVRTQDGDPIPPPTPEDLTEAERQAMARARAARLIRGSEFDAVKERVDAGATVGRRAIALGDSITAGIAGTAGQRDGYLDPGSWFTWATLFSDGRLVHQRNAGIPSNTLEQMQARLDADVIAHKPDIMFFMGGANSVGTHTAESAGEIIADIVMRARSAGIRVILCTLTPRTGSTHATRTDEYNAWIRQYGMRNGIDVLDTTSPLIDPATGGFASGYSTDGLHPTSLGAMVLGRAVAQQLAYLTPQKSLPLARSAVEATNLLTNGVFVGDANADGVADGWTLQGPSGTVATSLQADPQIVGNWQVFDKTAAGFKTIVQTIATSKWSVGDMLRFSGRAKFEYPGSGIGAYIRINFTGAGTIYIAPVFNVQATFEPVQFSLAAPVPPNTTGVQAYIDVGSGTGTGKLSVAQLSLINETRMGLA